MIAKYSSIDEAAAPADAKKKTKESDAVLIDIKIVIGCCLGSALLGGIPL